MANTSSAKKAVRVQERKAAKNLNRKLNMKSAHKAVVRAAKKGDKAKTATALQAFYQSVDKMAKHNGPMHKNAAARHKSRVTKFINSQLQAK